MLETIELGEALQICCQKKFYILIQSVAGFAGGKPQRCRANCKKS